MALLWEQFRDSLLRLLPVSPFADVISSWGVSNSMGLGWLNWFIPVHDLLSIFGLWLAAYTVYLVYQLVMRWVGMIA